MSSPSNHLQELTPLGFAWGGRATATVQARHIIGLDGFVCGAGVAPRLRECWRTNPAPLRCDPLSPRSRLGLPVGVATPSMLGPYHGCMAGHPSIVEVTRGQRVESIHRGSVAVVDCSGAAVLSLGDTKALVYPRSAVKPIQALPLVASGAADALGASDAEIALACGSHAGSPLHIATAESLLHKAGQQSACLECGVHWPLDEAEARAMAFRHESPSALHNNCSGKHAGIICSSCFHGHSPTGYTRPDHPAMKEVTAALAAVTGVDLDPATAATDGCSIPAFALPLESLALGFARIGTGVGLSASLQAATVRIRSAIAAQPVMLAGAGRFDTRVAEECGEAILVKSGAEGVVCAAVPALGLGIAVKIDDGAGRAATVVMAALLLRCATEWLDGRAAARSMLEEFSHPVLRNWNGVEVGRLRPTVSMP